VLDLDRQFTHAHAGGVVGRGGDGGGDTGQADLADPTGAEFVDLLVEIVGEMPADGGTSVHRHNVNGEVAADRRAVLRVVMGVLQERRADSHHGRALDLVPVRERIENTDGINDGRSRADAQPGGLCAANDKV